MARNPKSRPESIKPPPAPRPPNRTTAPPDLAPTALPEGRLALLPPDWLPIALVLGDAIIAGGSVLLAYWYRHNLDPIYPEGSAALAFGPYVVAIPFVIVIYLFALTLNRQYLSWRGRTLTAILLVVALLIMGTSPNGPVLSRWPTSVSPIPV